MEIFFYISTKLRLLENIQVDLFISSSQLRLEYFLQPGFLNSEDWKFCLGLNLFPYLFSEFLFEFYCSDFPHAFWLKVHAFWFILSSFNVFTGRKYSKAPLLGQHRSGTGQTKTSRLLETLTGQKDSNVWFWKAEVWFGSDDILLFIEFIIPVLRAVSLGKTCFLISTEIWQN